MTCFLGGPYGRQRSSPYDPPFFQTVCASGQHFCGDEGRYQSEHGEPKANML
jgi:hypothetical protein